MANKPRQGPRRIRQKCQTRRGPGGSGLPRRDMARLPAIPVWLPRPFCSTRRSSAPIDWQLPFRVHKERPSSLGLAGASRPNGWARCCSWVGARAVPSQAASRAERASLTATPPGLLRSRPRSQRTTAVRVSQGTYGSSWHPGQANKTRVRRRAGAAARPPAARSPGRGQHPGRPAGGPAAGRSAGPHPAARAGPVGASAAGTAPQRPGQR